MTTATLPALRFSRLATEYAEEVVEGRIPASKFTIAACQRHLDDLDRQGSSDFPWVMNEAAAEKVCRFMELMPHIKGEWATKKLKISLEPWQVFILVSIFGWVHHETGYRRFRNAYIEVPRKNAKTTLASGIMLYMLALDNEAGAECYSAATTRDQARLVFDDAKAMADKSPRLKEDYGVITSKYLIEVPRSNSKAKPITRESSANEGLNVHLGICDELHAHKNSDVYDVLDQGKGSRRNALLLSITTAGSELGSICYDIRTLVASILDGVFSSRELDRFFGIIYTIDEDDNPSDPLVWRKANPNFGVSVYEDDFIDAHAKAKASPTRWNDFLTKRLNVWVRAGSPWFDLMAWKSCFAPELVTDDHSIPEEFNGRRCYIGIDLASRRDIAAVVAVFPDESKPFDERAYAVFGRYYLPSTRIETARSSMFEGWETAGWITSTEGATTDFGFIKRDLLEWASRFELVEVPFDPREARQLSTELVNDAGLPMVEFNQSYANFNEPMKTLDSLIIEGRIQHNGDPVLTWAMGNVVAKTGALGDVMPASDSALAGIDPAVALLEAVGRSAVHIDEPEEPHGFSVYIPEE